MIEAHGIAAGTATEMLLLVSDNPDQIRSEAAFAKLCGTFPASSGKTTRHRFNCGGNRQANAARTAGSSFACAATSRPSTTSGDARPKERKMEIIRCLKRFVAREIFG
jgi:transposase